MTGTTRIAVGGWLWTGRPDGAGERMVQLVRHAVPLLHPDEQLVWLAGTCGTPPLPDDVMVHPLPIPPRPIRHRSRAQRRYLAPAVAQLGIDVLEAPCLPLPRLGDTGCSVVTTIHDLRDLHGWRRSVPPALLRQIYRHQLRRADQILVPSQATAAELRRHDLCPATTVSVVPNGVVVGDTPRTPTLPATVVHVGHLEPRKNLALLVATTRLLVDRGVGMRLVLAGEDSGCGRALRRQIQQLHLAAHVDLPGRVTTAARDELYRTCAAVAVPSRCEGFGLTALEGLAWGAPTFVHRDPALIEVVGDAATALPLTLEAWADALAPTLLDPTTAADPARRARAHHWNWPDAAATWLSHLRDARRGNPRW